MEGWSGQLDLTVVETGMRLPKYEEGLSNSWYCAYVLTLTMGMMVKEAEPLLPSIPDGLDPPPPFEDEPRLPSNANGPPPDFALYEADYFETGSGDIVSHDPHLNSDGARFSHGQILLPEFFVTQAKLSTASYSPERTNFPLACCIAEVHIPSIVPIGSQCVMATAIRNSGLKLTVKLLRISISISMLPLDLSPNLFIGLLPTTNLHIGGSWSVRLKSHMASG